MHSKPGDFPNIVSLLLSCWKLLVLAIIMGAAIGISLMPKRPPVWAASGLVKIAQINGSTPLVDAVTLAALVQQPAFASDSLEKAGFSRDLYADSKSVLASRTLVAIPQRSANLLQLQVSAYSPEEAKRLLEGGIETLQQLTSEEFNNGVQERKRKIDEAEALLASNASERESIIAALKSGQLAPGTQVLDSLVVSYLLRTTQAESERARSTISSLQDQLNPARTFNTKLITAISVTPVAQGGSKIVSGAIGAFVGFLIAFVLALIQTAFRTRRPLSGLINRN